MVKIYKKPETKVILVETSQIMAGSLGPNDEQSLKPQLGREFSFFEEEEMSEE